jgi:hypothetical protein
MSYKSKAHLAQQIPIAERLFSRDEFCAWAGISRRHYDQMIADGSGPQEIKVSRFVRKITPAAREAWLAQCAARDKRDGHAQPWQLWAAQQGGEEEARPVRVRKRLR